MNILLKSFSAISIFILFLTVPLKGDWQCRTDSTVAIVNVNESQWNVHLASDTKNGAIFVWQDKRLGTGDKLYVQRVNSSGVQQWGSNGIKLTTTEGYQYYPQILSDGKGGAFIVWQDNRSGSDYDIYAQRIDINGVSMWTPNGKPICTESGHQYNPQLTSDGSGGIIITWQDKRAGQFDIYAQRVDSLGQIKWGLNGVPVCTDSSNQIDPKITTDMHRGAYIAWSDYRTGSGTTDIYCQRISSTGVPVWLTNGLPICTAQNTQWNVQLVPDSLDGAIIVWQDRRNNNYDNIYAQRIDPFGNFKWASNGIPIAQISGNQFYPQVISDPKAGAIITWQDNRNGIDYDIYAQRVNRDGTLQWGAAGISICNSIGHQYNPQIIFQNSFVIISWQDKRSGNFDIYAQRLNLQGQVFWSTNGNPVAELPLDQFMPQLSTDSVNGAIIAWADYHLNTGSTDIYAQRIGANGLPAGGCFRTFIQDSLAVKSKRLKRLGHIVSIPNAGNVRDSLYRRGAFPYGIFVGVQRLDSSKKYGWMRYTRASNVRRALPQAGMSRPFDWIVDKPFVGEKKNYSSFRYNNKVVGELLALKMNIAASDVGIIQEQLGDIVFCDTNQNNPLNNKKLRQIADKVDSMLTMYKWFKNVNYSLISTSLQRINSAFDGPYDTLSTSPMRFKSTKALFSVPFLRPSADPPTIIPPFYTTIGEDVIPDNYQLYQNYPNPFNPWTTIEFSIPEPAIVTLKIYNIIGQEVAVLFDGSSMEDDNYIVDFDASNLPSGVYFYRLIAEPSSGGDVKSLIKKMVVLK